LNPYRLVKGEDVFSAVYGFLLIAFAMYASFLRIFLDMKLLYPRLNKAILIFERVFIAVGLMIFILHLFSFQFYTKKIFFVLYFLSIPFKIFVFIYLATRRRTINRIIMGGSLVAFIIGRVIMIAHMFIFNRNAEIISYEYIMGGIVILFLFLNIAMLFKSRMVDIKNVELEYKRQAELSNQREMISANLHDDLGASLSSIQISATMAQNSIQMDPNKAGKSLKRVIGELKVVIENMGDTIWAINPDNNSQKSISSQIKNFYFDLMDEHNIECSYHIDKNLEAQITNISARKNLLLIAKEAVNNILKHAQATKIEMTLKEQSNQMLLEIHDNGLGIKDREEHHMGNGLRNMKFRAEKMNGELTIKSAPGMGTTISCLVPYTNIRYSNLITV
jgi:signal transduction histidine kinase